jgi:hypothetical protein
VANLSPEYNPPKRPTGHYFLPPFINEDTMQRLRVMRDEYVYGHCVFMLRKGSPYMGIINSIVPKVRDTGLVLYWEDLTVRRYMSTRRQLSVINSRKEVDPGPTQLLLRHVTVSSLCNLRARDPCPLSRRLWR